jgi:hypothetical protein
MVTFLVQYQTANHRMFKSWSYCFNTPVAAGVDLANSFTGLSRVLANPKRVQGNHCQENQYGKARADDCCLGELFICGLQLK